MAKVNLVEKRMQMPYKAIIKYQLITTCFISGIQLSDSELNCLTLLGICGECELADFCTSAVEDEIFKTSQTVRNFLTKAEKRNFIVKSGSSRKKILLNPELKIQTRGNILLDYKFAHIVTQE